MLQPFRSVSPTAVKEDHNREEISSARLGFQVIKSNTAPRVLGFDGSCMSPFLCFEFPDQIKDWFVLGLYVGLILLSFHSW